MSAPRKHLDKITTDKMISPWRDRDGHDRSKFVLFCKAQTLFSLWTPSPRVYIYCYMLYVIWYRIYYIVYNLTVCVFSYCIFTTSLLMANFEWNADMWSLNPLESGPAPFRWISAWNRWISHQFCCHVEGIWWFYDGILRLEIQSMSQNPNWLSFQLSLALQ